MNEFLTGKPEVWVVGPLRPATPPNDELVYRTADVTDGKERVTITGYTTRSNALSEDSMKQRIEAVANAIPDDGARLDELVARSPIDLRSVTD